LCWKGWHSLSARGRRSYGARERSGALLPHPAQYGWGVALGNPAWRRPVQRQALLCLQNYSMKEKCANTLSAIQTQRYNIPPGAAATRPQIHSMTLGILSLLYKIK